MIPLQIFEKHPTADAYRVGGFYSPYCLVSTDKRFMDAELAAELWFAVSREAHAEAMGWRTNHAPDWINANRAEVRIVGILERFAALPHAHESDYE